ncbi:N-acetyltransferase family protein [Brucellaceae bacterium C25G]
MVHVRKFQFSDFADVYAIYADAVEKGTGSYEIEPPTIADMRGRLTMLVAQGFPLIVAVEDDQVLGYAYGSYFRPRPAFRWMVEDSIYIAEQARGKGIGKLLLKELIKQCTSLGFRQMVSVIGDAEGNVGSVCLHASLGFHECGRIQGSGFKHERWLDTLLMQLELNEGDRVPAGKPPIS